MAKKRIAIVGSRDFKRLDLVRAFVDSLPLDVVVVSGGARGVDRAAELRAAVRGIEVQSWPVTDEEWRSLGRRAGPMRNREIIKDCDEVVAFWDGESRGTEGTINLAVAYGKPVRVFDEDGEMECGS